MRSKDTRFSYSPSNIALVTFGGLVLKFAEIKAGALYQKE